MRGCGHNSTGPVKGSCEHSYESSGSLKCGEFVDQLRDYQLLNKHSVRCHRLITLEVQTLFSSVSFLKC
jgi:hypothetical protein